MIEVGSIIFQTNSLTTGTTDTTVDISVTSGEECVLSAKKVLISIAYFSTETGDVSFVVSSNPTHSFQFEILSGGMF